MRNFLLENVQFLMEYNGPFWEYIEQADSSRVSSLEVEGELLFKLTDDQGKEFYSASVYDTTYEVEAFLQDVNFDNTGFILFGLASSTLIKTILERKTEAAWVFVIEPDAQVVRRFLEEVDLSSYLDVDLQRLVFFTGPVDQMEAGLVTYLTSLIGFYFMKPEVLKTFPAYRKDIHLHNRMYDVVLDHIRLNITNNGNSLEDTLQGIENELRNLKYILKRKPFQHLKEQYAGKPAICVASGPSLDKQLPLLRQMQGKALIISAESTFRVLLKNGIEPDIVCILERGAPSYELSLAGIEIPPGTALVGLTLIDSRIYEKWHQYAIPCFKDNVVNSRTINEAFEGEFGQLYAGNSVAHMNVALANYLGADPIVLIGQDLAYSDDGVTHAKDSFYVSEEQEGISVEKIKSIKESLADRTSDYNRDVYVEGYYGGKVRSRELWKQFKLWMEHIIRTTESNVINATEGGARIEGTLQKPLREVYEEYASNSIRPITEVIDSLDGPVREPQAYLQMLVNLSQQLHKKINAVVKRAESNLLQIDSVFEDLAAQRHELLEVKAARVLRNTEQIVVHCLEDAFVNFFYRPLISYLHVQTNPISRVSSIERLREILNIQQFFLKQTVAGGKELLRVYEQGVLSAIHDLGFAEDEFEWEEETGEDEFHE